MGKEMYKKYFHRERPYRFSYGVLRTYRERECRLSTTPKAAHRILLQGWAVFVPWHKGQVARHHLVRNTACESLLRLCSLLFCSLPL